MIARRNLGTVHTEWSGRHALVDIGDIRFGGREWETQALCMQVGEPDRWFPEKGGDHGREAKQICMLCTVRRECLDANIDEPDGIYGGMSVGERQKLKARRQEGLPDPEPAVCERCDQLYLETRADRRFCSRTCKRNQYQPKPDVDNTPRQRDYGTAVCVCGDRFVKKNNTSRYCSANCRNEAKNARLRKSA